MLDTGRGVLRATRAALVTLLVVGLAASAHALGGGAAPGLITSGVLALLVGPVAWWCTRRRMTSLRLVVLLGGAQAAVHVALATMAPAAGTATAAHVHGSLPAGLAAGGGAVAHASHADPSMLLAHLAGTVLTALLLARGEDVLWRVVVLLLPHTVTPVSPPPRPLTCSAPVLPVLTGRAPRPLGGRAPPVALA